MCEDSFRIKSTEFHTPILKFFENGGKHTKNDVYEFTRKYFKLSPEEMEITTSGGGEAKYINYSRLAVDDLSYSPFLENDSGEYQITDFGLKFLRSNPKTDVYKVLKKYITFRKFKTKNLNFESKYHVLSLDFFVSSNFSIMGHGNDISFEYLFEDDEDLEKINVEDIILGYDKNEQCFKYLFEITDISDNGLSFKKILEISEGFKIKDSNLISLLENIDLCSIYHEEFKYYYDAMLSIIPSFSKTDVPLEEYNSFKRNLIYFGAPGTGKSHKLNDDKKVLLEYFPNNFERVTFHPDYSYASFVGTYKPVPKKDNNDEITYEYVPGPFMRVLSKAMKHKDEPFLLIIEEINRANVAAVFGDVFQLLDRKKDFNSEYPIDTSEDMRRYLAKELEEPEEEFEKIFIPKNMFIWATMNSADQGVFFMDTAFKRRWDFEYVDINNEQYKIEEKVFKSKDEKVYWNSLRKNINKTLLKLNINEDKCIGPFFIPSIVDADDNELSEDFVEDFKNKVLMYLFEDACKSQRDKLFNRSKDITYSNICEDFENEGIHVFVPEIVNNVKTVKINDQNESGSE